jgi:hypothetical protein
MAKIVSKWTVGSSGGPYDLAETSYAKTSGVTGALTNEVITGFIFPEANVRAFEGLVYVQVDTTSDAWQVMKITGIQKTTGSWFIDVTSAGDSGVTLDITSASSNGQLVYSIGADASRTAINMKFRAQALQI